ncbi:hypothetical protein [Amycolatopsis palatopharyngis]|uniref:sunset domain-containing protein n=1 Tax=Amycolatopsis palatopharyngis TaxID=187982 RepID=UPI000E26432D|nr:hypothetical protein [Amycolatopsis palatopharyngis]
MSIFGQVWLWSVAAFALGALLAWALLARPAQARVRELERRLVTAEATPAAASPREPEPTRVRPAPAQDDDDSTHTHQMPQVRPAPQPEPEPEPTEYVSPAPSWLERDSFERQPQPSGDETIERELAEYDWESDPEPAYDTDRSPGNGYDESRYDESGYRSEEPDFGEQRHESHDRQEHAQQDVGPYEESATETTRVGASLFQPHSYSEDDDPRDYDAYDDQPYDTETREDSSRATYEPTSYQPFEPVYVGPDAGEYGTERRDEEPEDVHQPAEPEEPETEPDIEDEAETAQGLPKRQRRESPPGGFDTPKPIQPSMRTVTRREPAQDQGSTHSGSLFEPAVPSGPPAEQAPMAPPARSHEQGAPVPSGPFGPGSAMPLPGGGRPSPDFSVKASVTALRYCTDGSAQFPQMVAEVWFRTPADAERVGFRPVS